MERSRRSGKRESPSGRNSDESAAGGGAYEGAAAFRGRDAEAAHAAGGAGRYSPVDVKAELGGLSARRGIKR